MQVQGPDHEQDLFAPRVVAVIGASAAANAVTARPLRFLKHHGFSGTLYAVNPRHKRIEEVACYPSVMDLPTRPDVAMIGVPAASLESAIADCSAVGVPLVSIFTAAVPPETKQRILTLAKAGGCRILGANSLGFINPHAGAACTYSQAALLEEIPYGALSILSQSGGLGGCLLNRAVDEKIGIARFLTLGTGIDLNLAELIEYLASSRETRVVAAIIEAVADGDRFIRAVERLHAVGKRLAICRIGGSATGRSMTVSHTGTIASDARVFSAVCRSLGVPLVGNLDDLIEIAAACIAEIEPVGPSIGVITSSGGAAIMVADALETQNLNMPPLSSRTIDAFRTALSEIATISNPLDIGAGQGGATFRAALGIMLGEPSFDSVVVALTMVTGDQADEAVPELIHAARASSRPLSVICLAGSLAAEWRQRLRDRGIAVFKNPNTAALAFRELRRSPLLGRKMGEPSTMAASARALMAEAPGVRTEWRTRKMLALYGIQSPREALVRTRDEAIDAARQIGFPVAIKVQSPLLPHRAAAGALLLELGNADAVGNGYDTLLAGLDPSVKKTCEGVLVQAMVKPEHQLLAGVIRDPVFGPTIACGWGGTAVEKLDDVIFIMSYEERGAIVDLLSKSQIGKQIGSVGVATIADLIVKLSTMASDLDPLLTELDINPVALVRDATQALALDALAIVAGEEKRSESADQQTKRGAQI